MNDVIVTGFAWAPPFAQGIVRDLRVRWALEEVGQSYDSLLFDLEAIKSQEYRQKNPFGQIPAMSIGGRWLFESGAIVYSIASHKGDLLPAEPKAREETIIWMFAALNTVEPPVATLALLDLQQSEEEWAKLRRPSAVEAVRVRLKDLSTWLKGKEYLLGRFTAADILMATVLRFLRHTDLVSEFAALSTYLQRCEERPAFQRALAAQANDYRAEGA